MLAELGVLAAFCAMACWGIGDFLIQRATRKVGDIEALAFIALIGAVGLLPFVYPELPSLMQPQNLMLLAMLSAITLVAAILDFEALKKGKLSVAEVMLEIELPVTVALGIAFFQEGISAVQFGLILLVMSGVVCMAFRRSRVSARRGMERGAVLALVAALFMGMVNFLTAAGSKAISPIMVIWVPWLFVAIMSFAIIAKREGISKTLSNASKFRWLILAMGIFDTLAWLSFALAVEGSPLSITIAITEAYPALAMFLGMWFNRERMLRHQYAGAAIALAASIVLGLLA